LAWLSAHDKQAELVTPYAVPKFLVYPVFGIRRLIDLLSSTSSVWWYRYWHGLFLEWALRRRLAAGRPCVIYAQCPLSARAALRARVSAKQRVVMVVHFNSSQADEWADKGAITRDGTLFRAIRALEAEILPATDGLVFVSAFIQRAVLQRIPAIQDVPMQVVPNFLADPHAGLWSGLRRDLITVGTLEYRKNQRYALEIIHAARQQGTTLTLTVVGDGPDRLMLEARVRELGIGQQVSFTGYVPDAAGLMAGHRACLHVAHMESFGIVLIEAMSRSLPVFAPAAGGMPEVFSDGVDGRLIPLDDAVTAARMIIEWLDDAEQMRKAGEAGRLRFLTHYEAGRVADELEQFLQKVAV
jgi:glycosyltransferase involved in cell wall biosynthesis